MQVSVRIGEWSRALPALESRRRKMQDVHLNAEFSAGQASGGNEPPAERQIGKPFTLFFRQSELRSRRFARRTRGNIFPSGLRVHAFPTYWNLALAVLLIPMSPKTPVG